MSIAGALAATDCTTNRGSEPVAAPPAPVASPEPTPPASTVAAAAGWMSVLPDKAERAAGKLRHVDRIPGLTDAHRKHLDSHGFFVTAQATPTPSKDPAVARTGRRAKHLFQIYERNDYIRFPSYVTVDLSVDLTHQYFDVILRRVEREHLVPRLTAALQGFSTEALRLRATAKTPAAKNAAQAAAAYWATALRLLEQPAPGDAPEVAVARAPWFDDPEARAEMGDHEGPAPAAPKLVITKVDRGIAKDVKVAVAAFVAAKGRKTFPAWGQTFDLTLAKPRSHYAGSGRLQRYFRAMTMLGLSSFEVEGDDARPAVLAALAMSMRGAPAANKAFADVLNITNFVVGEPPTADLSRAAAALGGTTTLDDAVSTKGLARLVAAWAKFPRHPVAGTGPVVQPMGQRVFADTQAMAHLLEVVRELPPTRADFVARAMGPAGSAAMLGSERAAAIVLDKAGPEADKTRVALQRGGQWFAAQDPRHDAYHATLGALAALLEADPLMFEADAHQLRMLQTFAGGWAMLRHDTLLYAYQMGAECDAADLGSPYGWVEPYPQVYRQLKAMVQGLQARLADAGVPTKSAGEEDEWSSGEFSIETKTKALSDFLDSMIAWSEKELRGEPFTNDERTEVAMAGGAAEHVVLTLADAFELGAGNDDMAVVADVFTFRDRALEVAVGHPELIYAVIPTPEGWALARGAVMAYREFFVPSAGRLTDEAWRERLAGSQDFEASTRAAWLAPIQLPPVGVIELPADGKGQDRCEYYGGAYEL